LYKLSFTLQTVRFKFIKVKKFMNLPEVKKATKLSDIVNTYEDPEKLFELLELIGMINYL
jgi:hypothetical protein